MVGGDVPRSSKIELEAKKAPMRSAFFFAVWTKKSFSLRNVGSESWVMLSSAAFESDQNCSGRVALMLLADFSDMLGHRLALQY